MTVDKGLVGAAGEHYVAFRLYLRGLRAILMPPGASDADIVVVMPGTARSITIQVKTARNAWVKSDSYWHWRVGISRPPPLEAFFYAFVDLNEGKEPQEPPSVFVVPSLDLKPLALEEFPKKGPPYRDGWFGIDEKDQKAYLNCWDRIEGALS